MPQSSLPKPDQRLCQLAEILVRGVSRWQQRMRRSETATQGEAPESSPVGLEVRGKTRLSVSGFHNERHRGLRKDNHESEN